MGMCRGQPDAGYARNSDASGIVRLGEVTPDTVTIILEADCLSRLLGEHKLYVEDFWCADERSCKYLKELLLTLLSHRSGVR